MKINPTCSKCGQSDEFLVSEDDTYICICGHKCTKVDEVSSIQVLRPADEHYQNLKKNQRMSTSNTAAHSPAIYPSEFKQQELL